MKLQIPLIPTRVRIVKSLLFLALLLVAAVPATQAQSQQSQQLTITAEDVEAQIQEGTFSSQTFMAAEGEEAEIQAVLDQIGEGGTYDFSDISLQDSTGIVATIEVQARPFDQDVLGASAFSEADYVKITRVPVDTLTATAYLYSGLGGGNGLYNYGSVIRTDTFAAADYGERMLMAYANIKSEYAPTFQTLALPLSYGTTWSSSTELTRQTRVYADLATANVFLPLGPQEDSTITQSFDVEVIGSGTLITPGGAELPSLVISIEQTANGTTAYARQFLTLDRQLQVSVQVNASGQVILEDGAPALTVTVKSEMGTRVAVANGETGSVFDDLGVAVNFTGGSTTAGALSGYRVSFPPAQVAIDNAAYDGESVTQISEDGYWVVESSGLSGYEYSICLDYSSTSGISNPGALVVLKRSPGSGEAWKPLNSSMVHEGEQQVCASGLTSFSKFAIGSTDANALPVELATFDATQKEGGVVLTWKTLSEKGSDHFEVQRRPSSSADGEWQTIGRVSAAGTTTEAQSYRYVDEQVPFTAEAVVYRLRQVDVDGTVSYSKEEVEVRLGAPKRFALHAAFPNPASTTTTIRYQLPKATHVRLEVYDVLGRRVRVLVNEKQSADRHEVQIDASQLSPGVYFYRLQAGEKTATRQLVVVR